MPPALRCCVPAANVKVFGKAVHNLARFGDDLYLEACDRGLTVKTANAARSAYGCFNFFPKFFHLYDYEPSTDSNIKCKVTMKSCLNAFRSLNTMEKSVDQCELSMCPTSACLTLQLHCKHGMLKTYNIPYMEQEDLKAIFTRNPTAHSVVVASRTLSEVVVNFQVTQEEVTFIASSSKIILKNYVEDDVDVNKVLYTQMTMKPDEFESYQVTEPTEITFCLKELRAILAFAEGLNLPLEMLFETAGKPVMIFIRSDQLYEGSFVLATLADAESEQSVSSAEPASVAAAAPTSIHGPSTANKHHGAKKRPEAKATSNSATAVQHFLREQAATSLLSASDVSIFPVMSGEEELGVQGCSAPVAGERDARLADEVVSTPPSKKFKSFFLGLSQQSASFHASQYPVLAEDTDNEDGDNG